MTSCTPSGPRRSTTVVHFCARQCWRGAILIILFIAVLITAARLLLPQLEAYRGDVEAAVSRAMGQPVTMEAFDVGWHRLGPRLLLANVQVWDAAAEHPLLGFRSAHIEINVWSSLRSWSLDVGDLTLIGVDLGLRRGVDGALQVEGLLQANGGNGGGAQRLQWLWRQGRIAVEESTVRWRDERVAGSGWVFENVNLQLHNAGRRHVLAGEAQLPASLGERVAFKLEFDSNGAASIAQWALTGYLALSGVELAHPALAQWMGPGAVSRGRGDAKLWIDRRDGQWRALQAELALADVRWAAPDRPVLAYDTLSGELSWQGGEDRWRLDVADLRLQRNGQWWPKPVRAQVSYVHTPAGAVVEGGINFARLEDVADVALLALAKDAEPLAQSLHALSPGGDVHDLYVQVATAESEPPGYFVRGELRGGRMTAWQSIPGVQGLDAKFNLDQDSGLVVVNADALEVDSDLFREALPATALRGQIAWQRGHDRWLAQARHLSLVNADISGDIDGQLVLAPGVSPVVRLRVEVHDGDGSRTSRYLPVKRMPPDAVSWLDRAIVSGTVTSGLVELEGPLSGFPYDDGSGRFEVLLNVREAIIDYTEHWPRVEQAEAEVKFVGWGMEVTGYSGKILNTDLHDVKVSIADLNAHPVTVDIAGRASGPLQDAVRYLTEAPELNAQFGAYLENSDAAGRSQLALSINLPLGPGGKVAVEGAVALAANDITFHNYDVDLTQVTGRLGFTERGLSADGVKAVVLGQPAEVNVDMSGEGDASAIVFTASGETRYPELAQRLPYVPVFEYLDGVSPWRARLAIPQDAGDATVTLRVDSTLVGTVVNLPHPLAKAVDVERPITVDGVLVDKRSEWRFDHDRQTLSGVFELAERDEEVVLRRGALQLAGRAELPQTEGIHVAGALDRFNDVEWKPILFPDESDAGEGVQVNALDLTVNKAVMFEYEMDNVRLSGRKREGVWHARVDADQIAGDMKVPEDFSVPLIMSLDYVHIPALEETTETAADEPIDPASDPTEFPPLLVEADRLIYGGRNLGLLLLVTYPISNGLAVERLAIDGKDGVLEAGGQWLRVGDAHSSTLQGELEVRDLGSLLKRLGYTQTVEKGQGRVKLDLRWPRPVSDPTVASLSGQLSFEMSQGALLEAEPGAGRLFGLLSVQALPRRMRLDFRDFFGKGFGFDMMRGRFNIEAGNAYTTNFKMKGPAADVAIRGRIGLLAQDYEQELSITPHVTSGLPLVGALTGGLGVGAAVLLAERLLKPSIDEATQVHYLVSGSWDEPVFTRVDVPRAGDASAQ